MRRFKAVALMISVSIVLINSSNALAQVDGSKIGNDSIMSHYGMKLGLTIAKTPYDGSYSAISNDYVKYYTQFTGGGFYAYKISPSVFAQIELLYSMKGSQYRFPGTDEADRPTEILGKLSLKYMELPITFKYVFDSGFIRPSCYAGFYGAFLLQATQYSNFGHGWNKDNVDYKYYRKSDFGWAAGFAAYFNDSAIVEFRYSSSIGNIINKENWHEGVVYKNRAYSLAFGIIL